MTTSAALLRETVHLPSRFLARLHFSGKGIYQDLDAQSLIDACVLSQQS